MNIVATQSSTLGNIFRPGDDLPGLPRSEDSAWSVPRLAVFMWPWDTSLDFHLIGEGYGSTLANCYEYTIQQGRHGTGITRAMTIEPLVTILRKGKFAIRYLAKNPCWVEWAELQSPGTLIPHSCRLPALGQRNHRYCIWHQL